MRQKPFSYWQDAWDEALRWKKPADRRAALECVLEAPFDVVKRLALRNRRQISRPLKHENDLTEFVVFANRFRRNVFQDVVLINAWHRQRKIMVNGIFICPQMTVGLIPSGLLIDSSVHAGAGSLGSTRFVNVIGFRRSAGWLLPAIESQLLRVRK